MTNQNQKSTKRALFLSLFAIIMCILVLTGTTFAWFTDSVTSSGNKIQAGTLKVDLELLDKESGNWNSIKADKASLFNNTKWEPGRTEVKVLKIENEGTLALKWLAKFVSDAELSALAEVIDVYVLPYGVLSDASAVVYPENRNLEGYTNVGTLKDFINTIKETTNGYLKEGEAAYLGIALKMQETAGNDYQGLDLGGVFDIKIVASQYTEEEDIFNNEYDASAPLDFTPVANANELKAALDAGEENILLTADCYVAEPMIVTGDTNIDGAGYMVGRKVDATSLAAIDDGNPTIYTGVVFTVSEGATLNLENVVVDGGAVWGGEADPVLRRGTQNAGLQTAASLVVTAKNSNVVLGKDAVLQNNDGAVAVNLGTRIGATLTLDGGKIINNNSECGAIWGGGSIFINDGAISFNSSPGVAGAIRMVSSCNLTMTGGEISNNVAASTGGAIYGYGASVYTLSGGKISGNKAATGGAFYTGDSSTINISGDFELCGNIGETGAGALRLSNRTTFKMSGGKVYGNDCLDSEKADGFYGWNPAVNITGGELGDSILIQGGLTPTVGGSGITGVINFDISTVHNTANLAAEFGEIKFTVTQGSNFGAFNLKPAADYVYTDGDEAKLVCLNDGYTTYFDAEKGVFKIKAD